MILLKLGQREHLEMLRKGLLYMNPLSYFTKLEADPARGDPYEGTDSIIQPVHVGEFTIGPQNLEKIRVAPSDLVDPIRFAGERTSFCNIFCMFAINKPVEGPIFSKSYQWFGDSFLLFTHTQNFLSRVKKAADNLGLICEAQPVRYYDEIKYSGVTGRFRKRSIYSHQSEYRITLETGIQNPFHFKIGDLHDITSEVLPLNVADDVLKFRPADATAAGLIWD